MDLKWWWWPNDHTHLVSFVSSLSENSRRASVPHRFPTCKIYLQQFLLITHHSQLSQSLQPNAKTHLTMMREHPLLYASDISTFVAAAPTYVEQSLNPIRQSDSAPPDQNPNLQVKRKRSLPGNPDPDAEVVALSPKSLLATNRFLCEICGKGFQRDQNLQLHRRGHNLPWKLKQRSDKEVRKKVYICPEVTCVHHDPSRALGDLTGIKKHFCRKHWEKKWKCERCGKKYAVQSDWKAHVKICGTKEYRCSCGTLFSRRDSFTTHRAFCDALSQESMRSISANPLAFQNHLLFSQLQPPSSSSNSNAYQIHPPVQPSFPIIMDSYTFQEHPQIKREEQQEQVPSQPPPPLWVPTPSLHNMDLTSSLFSAESSSYQISPSPHMSATALLQTAAQMGVTVSTKAISQEEHQVGNDGYVTTAVGRNLGFDGTCVDDAFGGMLEGKGVQCGTTTNAGAILRLAKTNDKSSCNGLTRDFLGLRALYSGGDNVINMEGVVDPRQRGSRYDHMQQMGGTNWHV